MGDVSYPESSNGCVRMTQDNFSQVIYTQYHGCKDTDEHHAADLLGARGICCRALSVRLTVLEQRLGPEHQNRVCVQNKRATQTPDGSVILHREDKVSSVMCACTNLCVCVCVVALHFLFLSVILNFDVIIRHAIQTNRGSTHTTAHC